MTIVLLQSHRHSMWRIRSVSAFKSCRIGCRQWSSSVVDGDQAIRSRSELTRRLIVVGLGNPGPKYERTVHNVGFMACDHLAQTLLQKGCQEVGQPENPTGKFMVRDVQGEFASYTDLDSIDRSSPKQREKSVEDGVPYPTVLYSIVKPMTYMNNSGGALKGYLQRVQVNPRKLKRVGSLNFMPEVVLVYDDINLPFGKVRLSPKGGAGGHNGVDSVLKALGTNTVARFRIGVAPHDRVSIRDAVLRKFPWEQQERLPEVLDAVSDSIRLYAHRGFNKTSNCVNKLVL